MNNNKKTFVTLILFLLLLSCLNNKVKKIEIVHSVVDEFPKPATYLVYTNVVNKKDSLFLIHYADSLINGRHELSAVGFFYDKNDIPQINPDHSIKNDKKGETLFAVYRYNHDNNRFEFEWIKTPVKKDK